MRRLQVFLATTLLVLFVSVFTNAQNVSINTDGSEPDASAMLDVKSTDKGMLIPRIDFNNVPTTPATGLLIYVTDNGPSGDSAFYYFNGDEWLRLATPSGGETDPVYSSSVASEITAADTIYWGGKLDIEVDGSTSNELQTLSISNDTIYLTDGSFVKLPAGFDGKYTSLTDVPANMDTDATDDFDGKYTSLTDVPANMDTDATDDFDGKYTSLTDVPANMDTDATDDFDGKYTSLTDVPANMDTDATDDFDGQYSSLTGVPTNIDEDSTNDVELTGNQTIGGEKTFSDDATFSNITAANINATSSVTTTAFTLSTGASDGYILESDASGNASWIQLQHSDITDLGTMAFQDSTSVNIDGGSIDGSTIGYYDQASAYFDYLEVDSDEDSWGFWHSDGTHDIGTWVGTSDGESGGWIGTYYNYPLIFFTNNSISPQMKLSTAGDLYVNSDLYITDDITADDGSFDELTSNDLEVDNTITATTLNISGNGVIGGTLGVTGATTLSSTLNVTSDATVGGNFYVGNTSAAKGSITSNNAYINGDLYVGPVFPGKLPASGNVFITQNLDIDGTTTGENADFSSVTIDDLEVYNTVTSTGFRLNDGNQGANKVLTSDASGNASWETMSLSELADADDDTKIQVEQYADQDEIRFRLGGTEHWVMSGTRLEQLNSGHSLFIGDGAGRLDDLSDNWNVFIGDNAGNNSVSGIENVFIGGYSGHYNTSGSYNTYLGSGAGYIGETSTNTVAVGYYADGYNLGGSANVCIGNQTNYNNGDYMNTGNQNNVTIGHKAGFKLGDGDNGNILIGFNAGYNETGSNKLYIENSDSSTPLIFGDFALDSVAINGKLTVTGGNPGAGKVLTSDANGVASWESNTDLQLNAAANTNNYSSGMKTTATVDVNTVGFSAALYIADDGHYEMANATSIDYMPCVALALETGTGSKQIIHQGYVWNDTWSWTVGDLIYMSKTDGTLTQTIPTGTGTQVQIIGVATATNKIFFNPNYMLIELK